MIAITGGSGSGKTTLARALRDRLGEQRCQLVTEDNYYFGRDHYGPAARTMSNAELEAIIDFDDPANKDMEHLRRDIVALRAGETIEQPVYDFPVHDRRHGAVSRIVSRPVVIVEGIHVLSDPSFAPLFDLTVFVEAAADLRLIRRMQRDVAERGRSAQSVIEQYLRFVRPAQARHIDPARHLCDIVLACETAPLHRGESPDAVSLARLLAPIWVELERRGLV
jgi:uridine kinase